MVERNVGVDNYKVDLAVKDTKSNNYILAIEVDSSAYSNSKNTRDRDIHRHKYLIARGFKTYRVFTKNWLNNKELEIERIISLIKNTKN